jgi:hypothetical protein
MHEALPGPPEQPSFALNASMCSARRTVSLAQAMSLLGCQSLKARAHFEKALPLFRQAANAIGEANCVNAPLNLRGVGDLMVEVEGLPDFRRWREGLLV